MKLSEKQRAFGRDITKLFEEINHRGMSFTFGEAFRSEEQAAIYAESGKGIQNSLHCKRLAIDINLFDANGKFLSTTEDHRELGTYWESLDPMNSWGGNFKRKDGCHYQRNE